MRQNHNKRIRQKGRPDGYCGGYEQRRKNGGKRFKERFKAILRRIRKLLEDNPRSRELVQKRRLMSDGTKGARGGNTGHI